MWLISWRDLQWRRRRFTIAIAGTSLVFAITLLMTGMSESLHAEAPNTVHAVGADRWIVPAGIAGPFTGISLFPANTVDAVRAAPGVTAAAPILFVRQNVGTGASRHDVNVIGYQLGSMGAPPVRRGRLPRTTGEAVVDVNLHRHIGDTLVMTGRSLTIVGLTSGLRLNAGVPNLYTAIEVVQTAVFDGRPVVDAVVTRGVPRSLPAGFAARRPAQVIADQNRLLHDATMTIDLVRNLLWLIAAALVGSVIYLSALERVRDFAVFKAVGSTTRTLAGTLAAQAVIISIAAAAVSSILARFIEPLFTLPTSVPSGALRLLPLIAVVVGLLASLAGLRRAVTTDPALAFNAP
jgi:putative ABC transport system permease protein